MENWFHNFHMLEDSSPLHYLFYVSVQRCDTGHSCMTALALQSVIGVASLHPTIINMRL